jgi:hypothetical protein
MHRQPKPVADILVSYSATEMPVPVIGRLRKQISTQITTGDIGPGDAYQIVDLLLGIALMKLTPS